MFIPMEIIIFISAVLLFFVGVLVGIFHIIPSNEVIE